MGNQDGLLELLDQRRDLSVDVAQSIQQTGNDAIRRESDISDARVFHVR
jgi:hypothetical protein